MPAYLIVLEGRRRPPENYKPLRDWIESFEPAPARLSDNVYIVKADLPPTWFLDVAYSEKYIHRDDFLLVIELGKGWEGQWTGQLERWLAVHLGPRSSDPGGPGTGAIP